MNKKDLLEKLERGEPVFTSFPTPIPGVLPRVCGMECEFGVGNTPDGRLDIHCPSVVLPNGGQFYPDQQKQVEFCTGECPDVVWLVAEHEAGKREAVERQLSPRLFNNSRDWLGSCFGTHENVCTNASEQYWHLLVPLLLARVVINGAGFYFDDKNFHISQRAGSITEAFADRAHEEKPIFLNRSHEPLANIDGYSRLHLSVSDGKCNESALFLSFGILLLAVKLLERKVLPYVAYDSTRVHSDITRLSETLTPDDWYLSGVMKGKRGVLELLWLYHDAMRVHLKGMDEVSDIVLDLFQDTLERFSSPNFIFLLRRRIDWIQKYWILDKFWKKFNSEPNRRELLRSNDLAYHDLYPETGLWSTIQQVLQPEKIVSEEMIRYAQVNPPPNVRSFIRGTCVQLCWQSPRAFQVIPGEWNRLTIIQGAYPVSRYYTTPNKDDIVAQFELPDPRLNYANLVEEVRRVL